MLKTLLKKELLGLFASVTQNKKTKERRSIGAIVGYCILFVVLFVMLGSIVSVFSGMLCFRLVQNGDDWLYFALIGLLSIFLGVFGSVFSTYSSLYRAKDNEQLLAMPIPPSKILFARMLAVWLMGFLFEAIVFVPSLIIYWIAAPQTAASVIFSLLVMLLISFFILTLSCILGWVVALIASKLKHKNIITVIISLGFLAAYYYFYSQAYALIESLVNNSKVIGDAIKSTLFPIYHLGLAATGNPVSMLITVAIVVPLFALVYWVLSHSFLKITTANKGTAKVKYKERQLTRSSMSRALLRKEFKRFIGSATYMLNCGLGSVFILVAVVYMIFNRNNINSMFEINPFLNSLKALAAGVIISFIASMNDITAPSISLEGKNIWILQSMPVPAWQVLVAKLKLHMYVSAIPALIFAICVDIVFTPDIVSAIVLPVFSVLFVLFTACLGLMLNLKMPNINFTNETAAVKQNIGVILTMFIGWASVVVLALPYMLVALFIPAWLYLLICTIIVAAVSGLMLHWLKNKGTRIFENL